MSTAPVAAAAAPVPAERLLREVHDALEHLKAIDIRDIDVRGKTGVTDYMVIASGTSTRHVKSIADEVQRRARRIGNPPIGVEGEREAEWVLVDLGDAIVHIMLPRMRDLYMLEKLWGGDVPRHPHGDAAPESA
ncbi:ribosome silencing factor [Xanthomonadaceae bacterium JHOS43]|nr:ribosome silencing factor [Xanthomonadaceae bacterium JHOS43]